MVKKKEEMGKLTKLCTYIFKEFFATCILLGLSFCLIWFVKWSFMGMMGW